MTDAELQQGRTDVPTAEARRRVRRRTRRPRRVTRLWPLLAVGLVCALLALVATVAPIGLWAYNVEKAGARMDRGLAWPEPRQSDSLPIVQDSSALDDALGHLAAAVRWRPDHYHAHRLAGQIYMARQQWLQASAAQSLARFLAPHHPLVQWEAGLTYEQMQAVVDGAPVQSLLEPMAAGQAGIPEVTIDTPTCQGSGLWSCYVGQTSFLQPYAGFTATLPLLAPVLFLHPPAQVQQTVTIPAELPALRFLLGLDPGVHGAGSDGATFTIWLVAADGATSVLYARFLDGVAANQGWVADWVDLSAWAGQTITLRLGTGPGPAGDTTADWVGWGDLLLTTVPAASLAATAPLAHMQQAWMDGGFGAVHFQAQAQRGRQPGAVARWSLRAARMAR